MVKTYEQSGGRCRFLITRFVLIIVMFLFVLGTTLCFGASDSRIAFSLGSAGEDSGKALTVDRDGNMVVAVYFENEIDFNKAPCCVEELSSAGFTDIALVKYSRSGAFVWARRLGGGQTEDRPQAVFVDGANNIYVAGYFGRSDYGALDADFDPFTGSENRLYTSGGYDGFLAKYDEDGNLLWALSLGNEEENSDEAVWDVRVDENGDVFVSGVFSGSVEFNPLGSEAMIRRSGDGNFSHFLASYDSSGSCRFALAVDSGISGEFTGLSSGVVPDGEGGCYWSGNYRGAPDFNPAICCTEILTSAGETDVFLGHYFSGGSLDRVFSIGGMDREILSSRGIAMGPDQNVYVTGRFYGRCDFEPGEETFYLTVPEGGSGIFVASYNPSGLFQRAFHLSSADGGEHTKHNLVFDSKGDLYLSGSFTKTVDFNPGAGEHRLTANGSGDIFLAKYNTAGEFFWVNRIRCDGVFPGERCFSGDITIDANDNVWITGQFYGEEVDFDPSEGIKNLSGIGENDAFLARYDSQGNLGGNPEVGLSGIEVSGPATVSEEREGVYACEAIYADGSRKDVTGKTDWSITGEAYGSRFEGNVLKTAQIDKDQSLTCEATYMEPGLLYGTTRRDTFTVLIKEKSESSGGDGDGGGCFIESLR